MKPVKYAKVKFLNKDKSLFFSVLRENIDAYFEANTLEKTGGTKLLVKAVFMLSLYLIPYAFLLFGNFTPLQMLFLTVVMGLGVAGVGMSVMHDAIHGSLSSSSKINKLFGASIYLLGGNAYNWDVQHNKLHHTYTNLHDIDEDITGKFMLRLSSGDKLKAAHRFQHIYAFFLYSLMTISFFWKDFKEISLYNKMAETGLVKAFSRKELIILVVSKIFYVLFIFVMPMLMLDITVGQWFAGFMAMHCTAGIILSTVFQLAHVVEGAAQPAVDERGNIENAWAIHQLNTTANFAGNNKILSWYIGGLDYQVEHHLFPNISHIHYPAIASIVKNTAEDFGIVYNNKHSFTKGLQSHIRMLHNLG
ncbi:MAG: acyl-CoA desaturase, partial [Emticicia sp.]|nr:acyl-CoA desaturase [Emticicia sp.]